MEKLSSRFDEHRDCHFRIRRADLGLHGFLKAIYSAGSETPDEFSNYATVSPMLKSVFPLQVVANFHTLELR